MSRSRKTRTTFVANVMSGPASVFRTSNAMNQIGRQSRWNYRTALSEFRECGYFGVSALLLAGHGVPGRERNADKTYGNDNAKEPKIRGCRDAAKSYKRCMVSYLPGVE